MSATVTRCAVLGQLLLALACGGSNSTNGLDSGTPDSGATTGSLAVNISGIPSPAAVLVTGPGGFSQAVGATQTLTGLAPGVYTLAASPARKPGAIVDTIYDPAPASTTATVVAGGLSSATIGYAARPGTGALYVPSPATGEILVYPDELLAAAGPLLDDGGVADGPVDASRLAILREDGGSWLDEEVLAVSPEGQLWADLGPVKSTEWALGSFTGAQQAAGGALQPQTVLGAGPTDAGTLSVGNLGQMAFDSAGNLWFSNTSENTVSVISRANLGSDGGLALADRNWSLASVDGLAFDRDGNLWYATCASGSASGIRMIAAQDLGSATTPAPAVSISSGAGPHDCPENIAFDSAGDLFVAECGTFVGLSEYPAWQLADGGSTGASSDPAVIVTSSRFNCPTGIAVDTADNVWLTDDSNPPVLYEFARAALIDGGSPAPLRAFTFTSCYFCGPAFNPPGASLPMAQVR